MDIGWQLRKINGPKKLANDVVRYKKKCNGSVYCDTDRCKLRNKHLRPGHDEKKTKEICEKGCYDCGYPLKHQECNDVEVFFFFKNDGRGARCELKQVGTHSHGRIPHKHLSEAQMEQLMKRIWKDPSVTTSAAIDGTVKKDNTKTYGVGKINPILVNPSRTEY